MVTFSMRLLFVLNLACTIFSSSAALEDQVVLEPGFDGTLNHITYASGFVEPTSPRHLQYKKRALEMIGKVDEDSEKWTTEHPRWRLLQAFHGYSRYRTRYMKQLGTFEDSFNALPDAQKKVINAATDYAINFDRTRDLWDINGKLAEDIVQHGLKYYGISHEELDSHITQSEAEGVYDNQAAVADAVNHYVRDWAIDGLHERIPTFDPLADAIEQTFPDRANRKEGPVKILTPGQGLGRLPHVLSNLADVEVTSNEYSYYMLLAYRFVESMNIPNSVPFHPFIDWWSYQVSPEERGREIRIPDISVNASKVVLVEGDFMHEFNNETARYDAVVTLFFIDTAKNALDYIDNINRLLKPGGVWVNLGPLLYGTNPTTQFTLTELVALSEHMGFEFQETDEKWGEYMIDKKIRWTEINYLVNKRSTRRNVYQALYWVAKKVHRDYPEFPKGTELSATQEHLFEKGS